MLRIIYAILRKFFPICVMVSTAAYAGEKKDEDPIKAQAAAATTLMKSKQWDGAKTILESLTKDNGENLDVLLPLAECYDNLKDQGKATETYTKALGIVVEKDGGAYKDSKDGKPIYDKVKKALARLDEATAMLSKYADLLEKEATAKFKGKNEFAYNKIMDVVKEWKGNKDIMSETEAKKKFIGKWTIRYDTGFSSVFEVKENGTAKSNIGFKWKIEGNTLTITGDNKEVNIFHLPIKDQMTGDSTVCPHLYLTRMQ